MIYLQHFIFFSNIFTNDTEQDQSPLANPTITTNKNNGIDILRQLHFSPLKHPNLIMNTQPINNTTLLE